MENEVIENIDDKLVGGVVDNNEELIVEHKENNGNAKELPTQQYLLECFNYDNETGDLYWNVRPEYHFRSSMLANKWNCQFSGKLITNKDVSGYKRVTLDYKGYKQHRLIWMMVYGVDTGNIIEHVNGIKEDNRIENLREKIPDNSIKEDVVIKTKELPEQKYLQECLDYNLDDGSVRWKDRPIHHFNNNESSMRTWNSRWSGKLISSKDRDGYLKIKIDYSAYRLHRVIWKLVNGYDPSCVIDHINGIKDDNRICNLREATLKENARNLVRLSPKNSSGYIGVHLDKRTGKWRAGININNRLKNLGSFDTPEEASEYRNKVAKKYYGDFYTEIE